MSTVTYLRGDGSNGSSVAWPMIVCFLCVLAIIAVSVHFSMVQDLREITRDLVNISEKHHDSYADI